MMTGSSKEAAEALVNTCTGVGNDLGALGPQGFAPLHFATAGSCYEDAAVFGILLEARADVNAQPPVQQQATALHRAVGHGMSREVVDLLIEAQADLSAKNKDGRRPIDLCVQGSAASLRPHLQARLRARTHARTYICAI